MTWSVFPARGLRRLEEPPGEMWLARFMHQPSMRETV